METKLLHQMPSHLLKGSTGLVRRHGLLLVDSREVFAQEAQQVLFITSRASISRLTLHPKLSGTSNIQFLTKEH
jgi:hypothetical protein